MKNLLLIMTVLLVFGLFVVIATAHDITKLVVPTYGDPRRDAKLECHYENERGDPPLHSVKWYQDNHEIFRFTPDQQPPIRTFNASGGPVRGSCTMHNCTIYVALPRKYNTNYAFICEVSTEGPRFAVVTQKMELTVAVPLQRDPVIIGAPSTAQIGDDIILNCTTDYAYPPASIMWYSGGKPIKSEPWMSDSTEMSDADRDGLRASWSVLQVKVETPNAFVDFQCEATQPLKPPHKRFSSVNIFVPRSPHLSMFTAGGTTTSKATSLSLVCMILQIIFSKCSALKEV